jgi:biotin synthesis protein BioG
MDGSPLQPLTTSGYDVYMLYDYRDLVLPQPIDSVVVGYQRIHLVSWSMGVWAGQKLFYDRSELFDRTIAINGTLCPIDDMFGIPREIFAKTVNEYSETTRLKFYRRMCQEKAGLSLFLARQPARSVVEQRTELAALQRSVDCIPAEQSIYKEIMIAKNDAIIPSGNQKKFWYGQRITEVTGFHFLFYLWPTWDDLLAFADAASQQHQPEPLL